MSNPKYKCRIDLWMWCENQDAVSKLREIFVEKSGGREVQMIPNRENTNVLFPLFHDLSIATCESHHQYSCAVEGNIQYTPSIDDFLGFISGITHGNTGVYELRLEYFCPEEHCYGAWDANRTGIDWQYIPSSVWPKDIDCKECAKTNNYLDSAPCGTCEAKLRNMLQENGLHYRPGFYNQCLNFAIGNYRNNLENKEKTNMSSENIDRPNLASLTDREREQIWDALNNISCLDVELVIKLDKAPQVLRHIVHLADCLTAIYIGEANNELSEIDDLSDALLELNRSAEEFVENLNDVKGKVKMTDDQRDIIVELIRNTIDYLHKQEVMLIQLAGTIEMEKEHPEPTPAEEIAREADEFYKQVEKEREQYAFPWGRNLGKKPDEDKPGLTHIVSETTNIVEKPMPTPIRDYMAGNRKQEPWTRGTDVPLCQPTASELAGEPPKGAWE